MSYWCAASSGRSGCISGHQMGSCRCWECTLWPPGWACSCAPARHVSHRRKVCLETSPRPHCRSETWKLCLRAAAGCRVISGMMVWTAAGLTTRWWGCRAPTHSLWVLKLVWPRQSLLGSRPGIHLSRTETPQRERLNTNKQIVRRCYASDGMYYSACYDFFLCTCLYHTYVVKTWFFSSCSGKQDFKHRTFIWNAAHSEIFSTCLLSHTDNLILTHFFQFILLKTPLNSCPVHAQYENPLIKDWKRSNSALTTFPV